MPLELGGEGPGVGHPDPCRMVQRRGDDAAAVWAERGGIDRARMPLELGDEGPGGGLPDPRRLIPRRGDDAAAVRAERGGIEIARMPLELGDEGPGGGLPDPRRLVVGRSDDAAAVRARAERGGTDTVHMPLELGDEGPGGGLPDPRRLVVGRSDDAAAVRARAERGGIDPVRMPLELGDEGPGGGLPDPRRPVYRRGDDAAAVRAERGGMEIVRMPLELGDEGAESAIQTRPVLSPDAVTMRLPSGLNAAEKTMYACPLSSAMRAPVSAIQPHRTVERRGDDAAAVRAERGGMDIVRMFDNRVHARHFADEESQTLAHRHLIGRRAGHCLDRTGEQMHGVEGIPLEERRGTRFDQESQRHFPSLSAEL